MNRQPRGGRNHSKFLKCKKGGQEKGERHDLCRWAKKKRITRSRTFKKKRGCLPISCRTPCPGEGEKGRKSEPSASLRKNWGRGGAKTCCEGHYLHAYLRYQEGKGALARRKGCPDGSGSLFKQKSPPTFPGKKALRVSLQKKEKAFFEKKSSPHPESKGESTGTGEGRAQICRSLERGVQIPNAALRAKAFEKPIQTKKKELTGYSA